MCVLIGAVKVTADVDLPEAVVSAAVDGTLVLFVGAGASFGEPSSLPSFNELAEQVAQLHGERYDPRSSPADEYIGNLIDHADGVREQVRAIISRASSLPNATHRALVRVAASSSSVRLVTTNYDEHLDSAADELGVKLGDRYNSPAVPLGRSFNGIVYLHGAVSRPLDDWVISDADFGRAYLTDGWARQFVQSAFETFTVLFVGYSHEDTVMSYLARGLPPSSKRYVLTSQPNNARWTSLRITPIGYPRDNNHAALPLALDEWANQLSMGALDHRERVKAIVSGGPPKTPVDTDYLRSALHTPIGVRAFAESAEEPVWLQWVESHPEFLSIFEPGRGSSDSGRVLSSWFAQRFAGSPAGLQHALPVLARRGPVVSEDLMRDLVFSARGSGGSDPAHWSTLATITSAALRTDASDPSELNVMLHGAGIQTADAAPLLRKALRPRLVLRESPRWWADDKDDTPVPVTANVAWSSDQYELGELMDTVRSGFPATSSDVFQILEQALRQGYELLRNFDSYRSFDSWSFHRNAIEPHEQNQMRDIEDVIVDGLRDASEVLVKSDTTVISRLVGDDFDLLRRLGVHLARVSEALTPDERLALLLSRPLIFDMDAQHEVYLLLTELVPQLDAGGRAQLLARIEEGPADFDPVDDARLHRRSVFDLLEWISRTTKDWRELNDALDTMRALEPMGVRPHPDMTHWMTSGVWGGKLPMEVDQFVSLLHSNGAAAALREVLSRKSYNESNFDEPTWDDALSLLRQTAARSADLGAELLSGVEQLTPFAPIPLVSAIISGWSSSEQADAELDQILVRLAKYSSESDLLRPLSELLRSSVGQGVERRSDNLLGKLGELADLLWERPASNGTAESASDDWTFQGLNTPTGHIASFWINRVRVRWRADEPAWTGLDDREKVAIIALLDAKSPKGQGPLAIIAGDSYFLFAADRPFAREHLFPLFEARDPRAPQAWNAYLYHPRVSDDMLDDGFWGLLVGADALVASLPTRRLEAQLHALRASVVVYASSDAINRDALIASLASSGDSLHEFTDALAMVVSEAGAAAARAAWSGWLKECVRARTSLAGVSESEKAAWGDLALRLGELSIEALGITAIDPAPLGERTRFDELSEAAVAAEPELIGRTVLDRLKLTSTYSWHISHQLDELIPRLAAAGLKRETLRAIADAALSLGIHGAAHWPIERP